MMLVIMPSLAFATEGDSPEQAAPAAVELPKKETVICRREPVLGSHFSKRICRTRAQMDAEREGAQRAIESVGRSRGRAPVGEN
jgi:hypothetical protein